MISLCDINVAKNIKPTWDKRNNVGEGTYSQYNGGGIQLKILISNLSPSSSHQLKKWVSSSFSI